MTSKVAFDNNLHRGNSGYQKYSAAVLVTKLASTTATVTAVTIVGWPAAAVSIALIAATVLMTRWILCSPERTKRLVNIISALRSKGTLPSPRRRRSKPRA